MLTAAVTAALLFHLKQKRERDEAHARRHLSSGPAPKRVSFMRLKLE